MSSSSDISISRPSAMKEAYKALLHDFACHVALDPDLLLQTEEVVLNGLTIGLAFEGNDVVGDLLYFTDLGTPASHRIGEVHQTLLEANHFWVGTGGATLGVQPETGRVVCCGRIDLEGLTGESLAMLLDTFIDTAVFWHQFVTDSLPAPELPERQTPISSRSPLPLKEFP